MCFMERVTLTTAAVEEWRPIAGYEGLYEVSNLGRVRSLGRYYPDMITLPNGAIGPYVRKGKIMKPFVQPKTGYVTITLRNLKGNQKLLHRLVAEAFVPNPNNLPEVNHKDEDKTNNIASNLEWCDSKYNKRYGTGYKRRSAKRKKPIEQLTLDGQHVAFYQSAADAYRMSNGKFLANRIYTVLSEGKNIAYGYIWRLVDNPINEDTTHT